MRTLTLVSSFAVLVSGGVAHAELSRGVISAFHGQLVVTKDDLPEGKNDGDTIKKINAARIHTVDGEKKGDVQAWHFHYAAFLTRTGSSTLKVEFLNEKNQLSATQTLNDVDPKSAVQLGETGSTRTTGSRRATRTRSSCSRAARSWRRRR